MGLLDDFALPDNVDRSALREVELQSGVKRYSGHLNGVPFQFKVIALKNEIQSKIARMEVFEDVECIVFYPDKATKVIHRLKAEGDFYKEKFHEEYQRFLEGKAAPGTPIDRWPEATRAQAATLEAARIFSVEQFAALTSGKVATFPPQFAELHEKAIQYLNARKGMSEIRKQLEDLAASDREKESLREELNAMRLELEAMQKGKKAKGGRPRKAGVQMEETEEAEAA